MKKIILIILVLAVFKSVYSQHSLKIKGCVKDLPSNKVYLGEIVAGSINYIDSSLVSNGCFDFYVSDTLPKGLYTILLHGHTNSYMRIILNKEDIEFNTVYSKMLDSMNVTKSVENQLFYKQMKLVAKSAEKIDVLKKLAALYPASNEIVRLSAKVLNEINLENEAAVNGLFKNYSVTFVAAYVKAQQPVMIPAKADADAYRKEHYFDNFAFSKADLLRTDVIASLVLGYLNLFESKFYTYTEQVENYSLAFDNILAKASVNDEIYYYLKNQLINRYRYGNLDILGAYLMQYYNDKKLCAVKSSVDDVKERLNKLNHVSVGKKAPDILMPTYEGKTTGLKDISTDYTLLVFWSTTCPHCTEMLPKLKQVYDGKRNNALEVVAVSFDTNRDDWQNFLKTGNYSWINYSDLKGWNSEIAKSYNIQGTPTFVLLNRDKTVIYKPATIEELLIKLRSLNVI